MYRKRLIVNSLAFLLADAVIMALALLASAVIRGLVQGVFIGPGRGFFLIPLWWAGAALLRLVPGWGLGPVEELRRTQVLLIAIFGMATAAMFLSKSADITSRIKFTMMYALCVPAIPLARSWVKGMLLRKNMWGVKTAIYGTDETVRHVLDVIQHERGLGYEPSCVFDDQMNTGDTVAGLPVQGSMSDHSSEASFAILGAPSIPRDRLARLLEGPLSHYRRVIIIPDLLEIPTLWVGARDFVGVLGLEVVRNLLNPFARAVKQALDLFIVLISLPVWLPVCAVIALLIWVRDGHHPLYGQQRVGRNRKHFTVWKFRTMAPDAEEKLAEALKNDEALAEEWSAHFKLKDDPRITPFGRFLRQWSLDELPQLINVLKCDMSLVGPRPLPPYHFDRLPDYVHDLRDHVLPGMTGMWQVSGRSQAGLEGMIRWDSYYVRNWSIWLDVVIVVRTIRAVVRGTGAY